MASVREITVGWGTSSGGTKTSVMYFDTAPAVATQRTALQTFLTSVKALLCTTASYGISLTGVEVDETTGILTGDWSDPTLKQGTGAVAGSEVPDASQAIIQWKTAQIINGRFLRGRTFIPGMSSTHITSGNVTGSAVTALQTAANTFIASAAGLVVWHRPIAGSGGSSRLVTTAGVWSEYAVLRRRRH